MEFDLRYVGLYDVHMQVFDQLLAARKQAREPARELVADLLAS